MGLAEVEQGEPGEPVQRAEEASGGQGRLYSSSLTRATYLRVRGEPPVLLSSSAHVPFPLLSSCLFS